MVIVYTSNTGYTERYAKMLADELSLPIYELNTAKKHLEKNTPVIYMGWLMASHVKDFSKASKLFDVKCLCGVGMGPTGTQLSEVRSAEGLSDDFPLFTLQGGFSMDKLSGIYKFVMGMLVKMIEKKPEPTEEEKWMVSTIRSGGDFVSADNLSEIIDFCRNHSAN